MQLRINIDIAIALFLATFLFGMAKPQTGNSGNTPVFDRLTDSFEENRVFIAHFTHEYNDSFTGEQQHTQGKIWIGKERYKIEGADQIMVVDGETSTVYDRSRNRVIVSDYLEEEDDFAPSRMLQGVDTTYTVSEQTDQHGETVILLASEDPFSVFREVSIYVDAEGNPLRIRAVDQVENELVTHFDAGWFTGEEPETFQIEFPEEAEQLDLRYGTL